MKSQWMQHIPRVITTPAPVEPLSLHIFHPKTDAYTIANSPQLGTCTGTKITPFLNANLVSISLIFISPGRRYGRRTECRATDRPDHRALVSQRAASDRGAPCGVAGDLCPRTTKA